MLDGIEVKRLTLSMSERAAANGDPEALGRRLLRRLQRVALATSLRGGPFVSLVLLVADLDASPLLLLSDLAQHSRNIAFDPRVSLLLDGTADYPDPLTGPGVEHHLASGIQADLPGGQGERGGAA